MQCMAAAVTISSAGNGRDGGSKMLFWWLRWRAGDWCSPVIQEQATTPTSDQASYLAQLFQVRPFLLCTFPPSNPLIFIHIKILCPCVLQVWFSLQLNQLSLLHTHWYRLSPHAGSHCKQ